MNTFLPYENFDMCAKTLDNKRLGNQCYREAKTLISGRWSNHPSAKMWKGYEYWLCEYGLSLALEMKKRKVFKTADEWVDYWSTCWSWVKVEYPPWLGDEKIHSTHRARLLYKDPQWYGQFGWTETPIAEGYIWPIMKDGEVIGWDDQTK